jgi:hypothetical protein
MPRGAPSNKAVELYRPFLRQRNTATGMPDNAAVETPSWGIGGKQDRPQVHSPDPRPPTTVRRPCWPRVRVQHRRAISAFRSCNDVPRAPEIAYSRLLAFQGCTYAIVRQPDRGPTWAYSVLDSKPRGDGVRVSRRIPSSRCDWEHVTFGMSLARIAHRVGRIEADPLPEQRKPALSL